jgi:hypothetical protein
VNDRAIVSCRFVERFSVITDLQLRELDSSEAPVSEFSVTGRPRTSFLFAMPKQLGKICSVRYSNIEMDCLETAIS